MKLTGCATNVVPSGPVTSNALGERTSKLFKHLHL